MLLVAAAFAGGPSSAQQRALPQSREQVMLSYAPLVRQAAPAVVNIYSRRVVRQRVSPLLDDPFFQRFFGQAFPNSVPRQRVEQSLGSGVILSPDGLLVTNHHVIKDADEITVVLSDRREFEARVAISDERTDLAVLRIDPPRGEALPFIEFRDSDDLEVGDIVLAIGNPFGVGQTVTSGIISAVARTGVGISDYNFFIQTDAAINPGNSGGALVAMDGRLVGINTAIFSRSGGSQGIGFAVPANMVRTVVEASRDGSKLVRPWIGVSAQTVTGEMASALGMARPGGVLVERIDPRSPAALAGLRRGDVIAAVNGRAVDDPDSLRFRIATLPVGGRAVLRVLRKGEASEIAFAVAAPPEDPPREVTRIQGRGNPLGGAVVANLSPALAEEIGFPGPAEGILVMQVEQPGAAARLGIEPGDVILRVNDREVPSVRALVQALERPGRGGWSLAIRRGERVLNAQVQG